MPPRRQNDDDQRGTGQRGQDGANDGGQHDADDTEGGRIRSLDELHQTVDELVQGFRQLRDSLRGGTQDVHDEGQRQVLNRLDRASSVEEQLQQALAERDRQAAEKQRDDSLSALNERLAKLEERPPEPPQPRLQRIMYGARDD